MASFTSKSVKTVSTGKVEFRVMVGEFLDKSQAELRTELENKGYSTEMAEKIVDVILGQVFGFLAGGSNE